MSTVFTMPGVSGALWSMLCAGVHVFVVVPGAPAVAAAAVDVVCWAVSGGWFWDGWGLGGELR